MSRHKHKYCRFFHVGMILTITSFFSNGWLNIYTNITFTADVEMKLNWHYLQLITPDQMGELLLLGIAGINHLNPISAGVILTPIHAEEGGGQKCPTHLTSVSNIQWSWNLVWMITTIIEVESQFFLWSLTPFSADVSKILHPRCKLPYV